MSQYIDTHDDTLATAEPAVRKTEPWAHQMDAFRFAYSKPATMLAMQMGCGKTLVAIQLVENWDSKRVLILCPKSVVPVWECQIAEHSAWEWTVATLNKGSVVKKTAAAQATFGNRTAIVINYESAFRPEFAEWALKQDWDCVICDESHKIKSPSGKASRFAHRVGLKSKRRLALTGTPMSHSPLDLYAQYRFLDTNVLGTSFVRFRSRYAEMNHMFPSKVERWKKETEDELREKYESLAFTVKADDVLDLKEATHERRTFPLSPSTRRVYDQLETDLVADVESGVVTASNALVKLVRLQQITSGFAVHEDGTERLGTEKADVLDGLFWGIYGKEPIVVFARFKLDLESIGLAAAASRRKYFELSGDANELAEWQADDTGSVLGVQIQAGSLGVSMVRAKYAVCYSLGYSLGEYEQALARIRRPGQEHPVTYYHLVAEDTVDEKVYKALRAKKDVIETILGSYRERVGV